MIDNLKPEDIKKVLPLLYRCYQQMEFQDEFDIETILENIVKLIESNMADIAVYKNKDVIEGVCAFGIVPSLYNKTSHNAMELIWHADPQLKDFARGKIMLLLLKYMEQKAHNMGANKLYLSISTQHQYKPVKNMLAKHGFIMTEYLCHKEV